MRKRPRPRWNYKDRANFWLRHLPPFGEAAPRGQAQRIAERIAAAQFLAACEHMGWRPRA